ncbi:MAG: hypothetical protein FDX21_04180 [Chlorobium sp.]|nr:MAG: hypothetical protein FDX21_04180 [Chlorobium sp.]
MKLFPDPETKKRFMKTGLPVILGIAWSPIIWIMMMSTVGTLFFRLTGSWPVTQVVILLMVVVVTFFLLQFFMRLGRKFGNQHPEKS